MLRIRPGLFLVAALLSLQGLLLCSTSVSAAIVNNLNQGSVEVKDQTTQSRRNATRAAMQQVLVKYSGNRKLLSNSAIRQQLNRANEYLRSYRFETDQDKLIFSATFQAQAIKDIIVEAGFPLWGNRRPDTLVWLVVESDREFEPLLLSEQRQSPVKKALLQSAERRGLPITLPLMDLTDSAAISSYDVWGQFVSNITQASERYQPEYVLTAKIHRPANRNQGEMVASGQSVVTPSRRKVSAFDPEEFKVSARDDTAAVFALEWVLITGQQVESGQLQGDSVEQLVADLTTMHAERLASAYALNLQQGSSGIERVEMVLLNINSIDDYVSVSRFLTSLSIVERAALMRQQGSASVFELDMLGTVADLKSILQLDDKIQPKLDEFGFPVEDLEYYWIP